MLSSCKVNKMIGASGNMPLQNGSGFNAVHLRLAGDHPNIRLLLRSTGQKISMGKLAPAAPSAVKSAA
jgi:hypothetical protein